MGLNKIYEASSQTDAVQCRAYLEGCGIAVFERPASDPIFSASGVYSLPPFAFSLFVPEEQTEEARGLIQAYAQESPENDADSIKIAEEADSICVPLSKSWFCKFGVIWIWILLILALIALSAVYNHLLREYLENCSDIYRRGVQ